MQTPNTLQAIVSLFGGHAWLALAAMLTLYARKLLSPASGFPITIPPRWLPVVTSGGAMASEFLSEMQAGKNIGDVVLGTVIAGATLGFGDSLVTAIFDHDNAPAWARAIVFVFDDITGGGPGGTKTTRLKGGTAFGAPKTDLTLVPVKSIPPSAMGPGGAAARTRLMLIGGCVTLWIAVATAALTGCPQAVPVVGPVASCVEAVVADALAGLTIDQILKKEGQGCVADAEQIITILLGSSNPGLAGTPALKEAKARRGIQ